ncbi:Low affinity iron permease-domain-containing protein [Umbelopsis sp. AD052]|nr:Low affinity iron permease-domain-containing protein [Umbelopsis sp. AD052]
MQYNSTILNRPINESIDVAQFADIGESKMNEKEEFVEEMVAKPGEALAHSCSAVKYMFNLFCHPGARQGIEVAAPTQMIFKDAENDMHYKRILKAGRLNRWLDAIVEFSGSAYIFFFIMTALVTWVFMGIPFGHSNYWQIVISDSQAILSYVFDSLLMRQQLNGYLSNLEVSACLRSRCASHKRMLRKLNATIDYRKRDGAKVDDFAIRLPSENWFGRMCTRASFFLGHIFTVVLFWIGIIIWLGFGQYCGWNNDWQLYINSATSAMMILYFSFLANIRERHSRYSRKCVDLIYQADSALEYKLRVLTSDETPNQPIMIPGLQVSKIQRVIDYYADLVGTLSGIAILIIVLIIWIAAGSLMSFSDNWWLLIGTYTGLIGMNDGFVLRNIHHVLRVHEDIQFEEVDMEDSQAFAIINLAEFNGDHFSKRSFSTRLSLAVGNVCSSKYMVITGTSTMVGLIIISSSMNWSLTGQLISNVPPSIIETFFMMILITGHNDFETKRRADLHNIYAKRLKLLSYVNTLM